MCTVTACSAEPERHTEIRLPQLVGEFQIVFCSRRYWHAYVLGGLYALAFLARGELWRNRNPQLIRLSCITWHWKKLLDEQWSRNLDYERWYLYRCSLYAPCGIFADYEFRFVLQLSQTVAQYNSTTAFCNLWWHSSAVIFVGNNNKIH